MKKKHTLASLEKELQSLRNESLLLQKEREKLVKQLESVDQKLASIVGTPVKQKVQAPKEEQKESGKKTIVSYIKEVLDGKGTMELKTIFEEMQKNGYNPKGKNASMIVGQVIRNHNDIFENVDRGMYKLKAK